MIEYTNILDPERMREGPSMAREEGHGGDGGKGERGLMDVRRRGRC